MLKGDSEGLRLQRRKFSYEDLGLELLVSSSLMQRLTSENRRKKNRKFPPNKRTED